MNAIFEIDKDYIRKDLHKDYGGQQRGGIATPSKFPMIFIFTGETGEQYGYLDYWDDQHVFHYHGEGQYGDMTFMRGNRAIRDPLANGEELHMFKMEKKGHVRYKGRMECEGYDEVHGIPDFNKMPRTSIVFRLRRIATA